MRIVTWNVNSLRARLARATAWLKAHEPDALCVQELKCQETDFPREAVEAAGYRAAVHGQKTYNGVAIFAKDEPEDVVVGFPGDPEPAFARAITATVRGVRILNLYCPNGQEVGSPKYVYKLAWFDALIAHLRALGDARPSVVCGDFNIAPEDRDVHDPEKLRGTVLLSDAERARFQALLDLGYADGLRLKNQDAGVYTWWDYRAMGFQRKLGFRIDHFLLAPDAARRLEDVAVDREERKGEGPSDHAPVVATFADA